MVEMGLVYFPGALVLIVLFAYRFTIAQTKEEKKNSAMIISMIVTILIVYSIYDFGFFNKLASFL
ncbi:hypothetical protein [Heyndrickxia ginsengihumi]|uniref:hypothetical protein n=1 Tax=Heyndrickxia ginsengihumi TaxID=363870 RepID=UPI000470D04A|nr:hypothetical protein [Heyndrickxia ginsengihumi]